MSDIYNVLWIDDEHDDLALEPFIIQAENKGVILHGYKSFREGFQALEEGLKYYDVILLDALFFSDENSEKVNNIGLAKAIARINQLSPQKSFPHFVLSGQSSITDSDDSFIEANEIKVFNKKKASDVKELLEEIKKASKKNPERQFKLDNPEINNLFEVGILSDEVEEQLKSLFLKPLPMDRPELKAILTNIRSIQESIFVKLVGINVLPKNLSFTNKLKHLSGNKSYNSNWIATSTVYQTDEIENLQKWIHLTCGTYIHHLEEQHYDGYMISNYAVDSLRTGLMELLLWFKKTYKENI